MSQALITLFRTAFTGKTAVAANTGVSTVRAVSPAELRQVVGGTETALPNRGW
jgi:hypothetical protein